MILHAVGAEPESQASTPEPGDRSEPAARIERWEQFFRSAEDPWQYDSPYEATKYEQTLELLPAEPVAKALELACAEGHFTSRLARLVGRLIASDISPTALNRARSRCASLPNVDFQVLDFASDLLPDELDLIVCSEALYYVPADQLPKLRTKFAAALKPGGWLLMAHACTIADDRERTGFDWGDTFGAQTIGRVFGSSSPFALVKELRTPLYRIHLFQRRASDSGVLPALKIIDAQAAPCLPAHVEEAVIWGGAALTRAEAQARERAADIPILMYHSIADDGPPELAQFRASPAMFREHLRFLRRHGYHSVSLGEWASSIAEGTPLSGRPVIITFDDGYKDFIVNAAPLLEAAGFRATVFVVTARVGADANWDSTSGPPLPLMNWDDLRDLQRRGFEVGSHTTSHIDLRTRSEDEIVRDCNESRAALRQQLGRDVTTLAYPWGWTDPRIRIALARAGFRIAVISVGGRSRLDDDVMHLPRIEITGDDDVYAFASRLQAKHEFSFETPWSSAVSEARREIALLRERLHAYEQDALTTLERVKAVEAAAEAQRCRAEAAERLAHRERLRAEAAGEQALTYGCRAEAAKADAHAARLRAEAAERQHNESLVRLLAIESSTIWRASAPFRSKLGSHPRLARLARRSARLLWLSLTFQLPRRLREQQRARHAVPLPAAADTIIAQSGELPSAVPTVTVQPARVHADHCRGSLSRAPAFASVAASLLSDIPVFICSFNNVTYVRQMLTQLRARGLRNLVVVDNASSVPEMQDYLHSIAATTKVVRLAENRGPRDIYLSEANFGRLPDVFCLTDPDLEFNPDLPGDFLAELAELTERFRIGKAGLALDISDRDSMREELFNIGDKQYRIWEWEEQFWQDQIGTSSGGDPVYRAPIDTTFALYNKKYFDRESELDAVRVGGRFTCRHLPWYKQTGMTRSEEETYRSTQKFSHYMRTAEKLEAVSEP